MEAQLSEQMTQQDVIVRSDQHRSGLAECRHDFMVVEIRSIWPIAQQDVTMTSGQHVNGLIACRHDFVVVETIDFYDDEDGQLPEPMTQRDVILLNKAAQEEEAAHEADAAEPKQDGKDDMEVGSTVAQSG